MTPPRLTDERIAELLHDALPNVQIHAAQDLVTYCAILRDTQDALRDYQRLRSERVKLVEGLRDMVSCYGSSFEELAAAAKNARTLLSSIDDKESGNG